MTPSRRRIANVMQKHMLHSDHAARCYIEAERRERAAKRKAKASTSTTRTRP